MTTQEHASNPVTVAPDILGHAQAVGDTWGREYPRIWDSRDLVVAQLRDFAAPISTVILPTARWRSSPWYWAAWIALIVGCAAAGIAGSSSNYSSDRGAAGIVTTLMFLLAFALWLASVFHTSAKNHQIFERRQAVEQAVAHAALDAIETRRNEARSHDPSKTARAGGFVPAGPAPLPQTYGVSHEGAERLVAEWMSYLGAKDVAVTSFAGDGGVDVASLNYIAQVKNYAGSVDVESIRALGGVAYADGRKPLFFTSGTYTAASIAFASQVGMALFRYDAVRGSLEPVGDMAAKYMTTGL